MRNGPMIISVFLIMQTSMNKYVFLKNTRSPTAMLHPGGMLQKHKCFSNYRAAGGNATPIRNALKKRTHIILNLDRDRGSSRSKQISKRIHDSAALKAK